jgi:hypothetical protein
MLAMRFDNPGPVLDNEQLLTSVSPLAVIVTATSSMGPPIVVGHVYAIGSDLCGVTSKKLITAVKFELEAALCSFTQ